MPGRASAIGPIRIGYPTASEATSQEIFGRSKDHPSPAPRSDARQAVSGGPALRLAAKHARKDRVDVLQVVVEVELFLELGGR